MTRIWLAGARRLAHPQSIFSAKRLLEPRRLRLSSSIASTASIEPAGTSSTVSQQAAATATGSGGEEKEELSWATWPARNPWTTLFLSVVSAWVYSLWVQNKTNKLRDTTEEAIRAREPVNEDEVLELRSLNDVPSEVILALPAALGHREMVRADQIIVQLRKSVSRGQPLKEEYAVERMLMSLPGAPMVDVRLATAALAVLSSGNTAERLEAVFEVLGERPTSRRGAPRPPAESINEQRLLGLMRALMATSQVPADKRIYVHDEGKNAANIAKSWYQVPPVREWTAEEWCDILLRGQYAGATTMQKQGPMPMPPDPTPTAVTSDDAAAAAAKAADTPLPRGWQLYYEPASGRPYWAKVDGSMTTWEMPTLTGQLEDLDGSGVDADNGNLEVKSTVETRPTSVDLGQFCEMMTSDLVCIWGECHRIAERKRLAKKREEDEDYQRNPPWYKRVWDSVRGGSTTS